MDTCCKCYLLDLNVAILMPVFSPLKAYHDMATHDVDSGMGGLDASIRFELDRPEVCIPQISNIIPNSR